MSAATAIRRAIARRLFGDLLDEASREAESDRGWRSIGAGAATREITPLERQVQLDESDEAYRSSVLGFRVVELGVDYVLGRGLALRSTNPEAQKWLDTWWNHPLNAWDTRQFDLCRELSLAGEVFVTFHTNAVDGMTYVRCIPARLVDQVETSPEDLEDELRFHRAGGIALVGGGISTERWWQGSAADPPEMRHFAVNRLVGTTRGQGDLVVLLPWLRRYRDWLVDRVRINRYRQAYLWDVAIKGADRRAINARRNELGEEPAPGSINIHNDSETWQALKPELASDNAERDGLALRLAIAAGSGFPLHFLGEAAEANLATAQAMEAPTIRRLERRQLYFGWMVAQIAREALRRSGHFDDVATLGVRAEFETLRPEDQAAIAISVSSIVAAAAVARDRNWISDAEARELFARFVGAPATSGDDFLRDDAKRPIRPSAPPAQPAQASTQTGSLAQSTVPPTSTVRAAPNT